MNLEKIYYDNIFYYTNVIEDPQKVIDDLERINGDEQIHQSISMWKQDSCHRERKDLFFDKRDSSTGDNRLLAKEIIENMRGTIERIAKQFVIDKGLDIEPNVSPSLDMCKYPPGGGLGVHHDTQDGDMNLLYSIVLYFNEDHELYENKAYDLLYDNDLLQIKNKDNITEILSDILDLLYKLYL